MADFQASCFGDDYQTSFDVAAYLARIYPAVEGDASLSRTKGLLTLNSKWVEAFALGQIAGQRLLELGCGPSIHAAIPVSRCFDEIYMCEYAAPNRQAIQDWIDRKPTAHDWTPFLQFVAEEEGEGASHEDIEERVRGKIKSIAPCDISKDNLFEPDYFEPEFFDCIICSFCMEHASRTEEGYKAGLKKVASYLKPRGNFILAGPLYGRHYQVGDKLFFVLTMTPECLKQSLEEAGFVEIKLYEQKIGSNEDYKSDATGWYFLTCIKGE